MNTKELIERIEGLNKLYGDNKNYVSYDDVLNLVKQLDEPQPIKLKDVTTRIKQLDIGTRKVWLDEFLNELGSDYGTLKYKDGYEQGKLEGLIEREKVQIPKLVAEEIERFKESGDWDLFQAMDYSFGINKIREWLEVKDNQEIFARAWLDGYTVEEKLYKVVMPNVSSSGGVLTRIKHDDSWIWIDTLGTIIEGRTHTRKELEQAGFGWVFDCPGVEIEEVEE